MREKIKMYITFKNNSTGAKMIVTVENQKHVINPECSVDIFFRSEKSIPKLFPL